jgi:hypothetical protein
MKTRMVEVREGEYIGPIDWDETKWPFQIRDEQRDMLRAIEADPDGHVATTDGGWPKFGYHDVLRVGMYDVWPYWRPGPAMLMMGPLGSEWHWANEITGLSARRTGTR